MKITLLFLASLSLISASTPAPLAGPDGEWVKGLKYTTDWKKAIKSVKETGRMLFIYNGWQRAKV